MPITKSEFIWMDGKLVPWDQANIHILSHVIHYGSGLFEGIRVYNTKRGPAAFRLADHIDRLFNSAKIYRFTMPWTREQVAAACLETVRVNKLDECYIRPLVYRGYGEMGVNPLKNPVNLAIAVWPWGAYLGAEALEQGVDTMVSSWSRTAPNTTPATAKATANYMNSQLMKMEALEYGFAEGISLDVYGSVAEGSGENIFVVHHGEIITPPLYASILPGITRDGVITLAQEMGIRVREEQIPRGLLYYADEVFFTGTASEVTPVRSVDKILVGEGKRGPVTGKLQAAYLGICRGDLPDTRGWLTPIK